MDFEKKIKKLEKIVEEMEKGDIPLEQALKNFEEGVKLSRQCYESLNKAEQKVKILIEDDKGNSKKKDFDVEKG